MNLRPAVLAIALLVPVSAAADPITSGIWTGTASTAPNGPVQALDAAPFWSGLSYDCEFCGVGYVLGAFGDPSLEYLHDGDGHPVSFRFDEPITTPTFIYMNTWRSGGVIGQNQNGAITFNNGIDSWNSWDDPLQFALFRLTRGDSITYFLGIEDMPYDDPLTDHDYNDYVARFSPQPVPEPGTLLLLGSGVAAIAARRRTRALRPHAP
jgi:PEP-CTERM motif